MSMSEESLCDIFLDLHKANYALDRDLCIDILAEYRVSPWYLCLLRHYWARMTIVVKAGGYIGTPFKVYCGVTQGYLICPTTFNVVLEVVLKNWVAVVVSTEDSVDPGVVDTEGFG